MGALVAHHGYLGAQVVWYQTWTGRIAGTLGQTLGSLPGPEAAWVLPVTLAITVPLALGWALRPVAPFWIGPLLFLALVVAIPERLQDLAWPNGGGTYLFPFLALAVLIGLELRGRRGMILPALAGFFVGGSNEVLAFGAGAAWLLLLVAYRRPTLAAALAGIAIAVALDAVAPGTAARAVGLNPPHLYGVPFYAAQSGATLLISFVTEPRAWAAALLAGMFMPIRPSSRLVAFAWVIALVALCAAMLPNALVDRSVLVARAWIGPEFGLLLALALTGSALAARRPSPRLAGAALAVCVVALVVGVSATLATTGNLDSWHLGSPPTTTQWVVQCISDYYSSH